MAETIHLTLPGDSLKHPVSKVRIFAFIACSAGDGNRNASDIVGYLFCISLEDSTMAGVLVRNYRDIHL